MRRGRAESEMKIVKLVSVGTPYSDLITNRRGKAAVYADASLSEISEMLRNFGENLRSFGEIGTSQSPLSPFYH
jgi:hypothetical protein